MCPHLHRRHHHSASASSASSTYLTYPIIQGSAAGPGLLDVLFGMIVSSDFVGVLLCVGCMLLELGRMATVVQEEEDDVVLLTL